MRKNSACIKICIIKKWEIQADAVPDLIDQGGLEDNPTFSCQLLTFALNQKGHIEPWNVAYRPKGIAKNAKSKITISRRVKWEQKISKSVLE